MGLPVVQGALVLLVEDDTDIRDTLSGALETHGVRVVAAANGRDAFAAVRTDGRRPDLILLDLQMPVMDGAEFLEQQPSEPLVEGVPVVILTAQLRLPVLEENVRAILRKPVALAAVLEAIREVHGREHGALSEVLVDASTVAPAAPSVVLVDTPGDGVAAPKPPLL